LLPGTEDSGLIPSMLCFGRVAAKVEFQWQAEEQVWQEALGGNEGYLQRALLLFVVVKNLMGMCCEEVSQI
jgi:hypothetical protein